MLSPCRGTTETIEKRYQKLKCIITEMQSVLVAFSGGLDSSVLLAVASDVLGENCIGATFTSVAFPQHELARAREVANLLGVRHIEMPFDLLQVPGFVTNTPQRCYYCKRALMLKLQELARQYGLSYVADGTVTDDAEDFRPGARAVQELGVRSPLAEAGLCKADVEILASELKLPTAGVPSMACLASRIPYGTPICIEALQRIEAAESLLHNLGFSQVRVRHEGKHARIEVLPPELPLLVGDEVRGQVVRGLLDIGFTRVVADLRGYRTGSMNDFVTEEETSSG